MKIIDNPKAMREHSDAIRSKGKTIAFVPTMGYFHEGHASLMRIGRKLADELVLSIFVNPTQFGPEEDFKKYPRDMDRDLKMAAREGVDTVYAPTVEAMYPEGFETYVRVDKTSLPLCGVSRPIHFRGVSTVCAKLFNAVAPHFAIFGEKDYQQLLVIKRMVLDLDMGIEIVAGPTLREPDGLAMSSRNVYLSPEQRKQAAVLHRSLGAAEQLVEQCERDAGTILAKVREIIDESPLAEPDYIELRTLPALEEPQRMIGGPTLLALAIFFGKTRLIDNTVLLRHIVTG